jgi:hypothetical protein
MTLSYSIKGKGAGGKVVIPIVPPLSGYNEVKPRLLEMKYKAQEGLGMVRNNPQDCKTSLILIWYL